MIYKFLKYLLSIFGINTLFNSLGHYVNDFANSYKTQINKKITKLLSCLFIFIIIWSLSLVTFLVIIEGIISVINRFTHGLWGYLIVPIILFFIIYEYYLYFKKHCKED